MFFHIKPLQTCSREVETKYTCSSFSGLNYQSRAELRNNRFNTDTNVFHVKPLQATNGL